MTSTAGNHIAVSDFQGLGELKAKAHANSANAAKETAREFEALFVQTMLKTMRASQHILDEDSPFRSQAEDTFQEMRDAQYAKMISQGAGVGLATALEKQLNPAARPSVSSASPDFSMAQPDSVQHINPLKLSAAHGPADIDASEKTKPSDAISNFVRQLWPHAKKLASVLGLDPQILIAQAALETGWGKNIAQDEKGNSSFNLFNIKSSQKDEKNAVNIKTTEYLADKPIKMNQWFKRYTNLAESFADYFQLISGSDRYANAMQHGGDSRQYIQSLQDAGYASDPQYAHKVLQVYEGSNLQAAIKHVAALEKD